MKVDSSYPDAWPFTEADFPTGSEFLNVDGAPMALLPGPTLVNFFSGKARIIPTSALKADNNSEMPFEAWSAFVGRCAATYAPAWADAFTRAKAADEPSAYQCSKTGDILVLGKSRAYFQDADSGFDIRMLREAEEEQLGLRDFDKAGSSWSKIPDKDTAEYFFREALGSLWRKPPEPDLRLDHWLNRLSLAMINRWSRREMPDLMPVLELALHAVPEGQEDGPEGQAFDRARRLASKTVLTLLEDAFQPEDLLDATDLEDAAQMILNAIEGFGEITDSQLYREREERDE